MGFFHKNNFIQWEKTIIVNLINTAFLIKNLIPILKKIIIFSYKYFWWEF